MQRLLIAALTVLIFGAGYATRLWTERASPVPPPAPLGAEFSHGLAPTKGGNEPKNGERPTTGRDQPINRAKLISEIESIRPKVEAYRKQLDTIDADFSRDFQVVLTADQKRRYAEQQKRFAERRAKGEARDALNTAPLSDEQIYRLQYQRPLYSVLGALAISPRLQGLTDDLKLDAQQQERVRDLLRMRRDKFIDLVDSSPPPTITLSRLVPVVQKLAGTPEKP